MIKMARDANTLEEYIIITLLFLLIYHIYLKYFDSQAWAGSVEPDQGLHFAVHIMKTRLFKYIENFTSKNWKFSDKKLWYFLVI